MLAPSRVLLRVGGLQPRAREEQPYGTALLLCNTYAVIKNFAFIAFIDYRKLTLANGIFAVQKIVRMTYSKKIHVPHATT